MSRVDKTKAAYLAALRRLEKGRPTHPRLVGQRLSINVSTVCLEAGLSRNPLYAQHHRDVLDEIHAAAERQRGVVQSLRKGNARNSRRVRRASADRRATELGEQLAKARSENLTLFFRLQVAEERLTSADGSSRA
ncbi:MAG TPA: hypothetical protein VKQ30_16365 [Ktedonobacterales bacterium]|nr:hypothetical protein [Ktedonobacterales bacterium]